MKPIPLTGATVLAAFLMIGGGAVAFIHRFGNSHADLVAGAIVVALGGISVPLHAWLATLVFDVPPGVYDDLLSVGNLATGLLTVGAVITVFVAQVFPTGAPFVAAGLAAAALVSTFVTALFKASVVRAAKAARAHPSSNALPTI